MTEQKKMSLRVLDGQTEFAEDELQKLGDFVNRCSKPFFYIALVAAALFFGNRFYQDAQLQKQKSGAEQLQIVQESLDELTKAIITAKKSAGEDKAKSEKLVADLEIKLAEQTKTLADRPEPYKKIAAIYGEILENIKAGKDSKGMDPHIVQGLLLSNH